MTDYATEHFDWVTAQARCTAATMFDRLLEGAREDVSRRNAVPDRDEGWRFECHNEDGRFEVVRTTESGAPSSQGAFVAFERVGPRIHVHGDGVDVDFTAIVGINASGECRYYVGEAEYLGWEVRKLALDLLFFEEEEG
ncbi:MAG: hypothetical protein R2712_16565 [Vicinamibacterales bacterium]